MECLSSMYARSTGSYTEHWVGNGDGVHSGSALNYGVSWRPALDI